MIIIESPFAGYGLNRAQRYLGLFDEKKKEDRVPIDSVRDIYKHADRLKAMLGVYES